MIFKFFLILLGLTLMSWEKERKDVTIVNQIRAKIIKELTSDRTLCLEAVSAAMLNEVKEIGFHFRSPCKMDLNEARKIYVKAVATLLKEINTNKEIRKYLIKYPFTFENTDIVISFRDNRNVRAVTPNIALISRVNLKIFYDSYNDSTDTFKNFCQETFEEAVKIVEESTGNKIDFGY